MFGRAFTNILAGQTSFLFTHFIGPQFLSTHSVELTTFIHFSSAHSLKPTAYNLQKALPNIH